MSNRFDRTLVERLISEAKRMATRQAKLEASTQTVAANSRVQSILAGRVTAVDSTGAETTYSVRHLSSANRIESDWIIASVISIDPGVVFAAGDYVLLVLNNSGMSYAMASSTAGGGASGAEILPSGWSVAGS